MAGFHVEFGINETQLTRLLEDGLYKEAESAIKDNNSPSYLDEGCYQRTPFFIVLSGENQTGRIKNQRNFYIAKCLVQYGANVNYRVPITDGAEFVSPGSTPLELAVEYFLTLSQRQAFLELSGDDENTSTGANSEHFMNKLDECVIGLDNKPVRSISDIQDDLLDLVFIMLGNGGDINIRDEFGQTLLHRSISRSAGDLNLRLIRLLVESCGDLNVVDHKGNTPLVALCNKQIRFFNKKSEESIRKVLEYLLAQETLQVDKENKAERTALFCCVIRGNVLWASLLLRHGADPTKRGKVTSKGWTYSEEVKCLSPLFAYLCSPWAFIDQSMEPNTGAIAHLVDAGHFNTADITHELHGYIEEDHTGLDHLKVFGSRLVNLMFGKTTASLRQLCVRNIFENCFDDATNATHSVLGTEKKLKEEDLHPRYGLNPNDRTTYWTQVVTPGILRGLISRLSLPADSLVYFEAELLARQLCSKLFLFRYPNEDYLKEIDWTSDSDISSSDEGESDIEYW